MYAALYLLLWAIPILAVNFPFENDQLTEAETVDYDDIRFAGTGDDPPEEECKLLPEDEDWPEEDEWAKFNDTLAGALLKPLPLANVCYAGSHYDALVCAGLRGQWARNTILQ
jgi:hypothetical protein